MKAIKNGWSVLFCLVAVCGLLAGCDGGTIAASNTAPVANAGIDQTIELGDTATLDGSGSSDADGDTLTFQWTLLTAPSGGTASIVNETSPTASLTPDAEGNWEIQLVVNDGQENSTPDALTVQVVSQACTSDAQCNDDNPCTTDTCDNGGCVNTPLAEGTSCDDGMYCNGEETCDAGGTCQAGELPCPGRACDEANQSCVGCTSDDVCPACQYCSNGACVNQAAGDDLKDDCAQDACHPGICNGNGACSTEADGTDCDVCGACNSGTCTADLTQDDDCPLCQECSDLGTCTNQAADSDVKNECPDADFCDGAEKCDGNGACQDAGADPCPGLVCDEANDRCTGCLTDADCPLCTECISDNCENQAEGSDSKDDCTQDACHTGNCDGAGACGLEPQGTDCGQCRACDNTGTCADDLTQDADCPTCQECAAGGTCTNQASGVDIKGDCTDSAICNGLELCDGSGGCTAGTAAADGTPCDEGAGADGDECNSSCLSGACAAATPPTCNDGLVCNGLETCTTGSGCTAGTAAADGIACDEGAGADSNYCNSSCQSGVCDAGTAADCDDGLMCNGTETCNTATGCVAGTDAADGTPCDEGAGENSDECDSSCQSGVCDDSTAATCDDGVVCNGAEVCTTGSGCGNAGTNAPDGTACDEDAGQDSNWCNSSCVSGACTAATPPTCGDALICNGVDSCNPASGCETTTPPADGTPCDEGVGEDTNWCNSSCQSGVCSDATAATCDDSLMCNGTETCNTASGCVAGTNADDGVPCDEGPDADGDECNSSCQSGVCTAGTNPVCDDGLLCNGTETCTTGSGCVAGTAATDGTPCDEGSGEDDNECNSSCQSGVCDSGTNATSGLACDDDLVCTESDECSGSGACTGTAVDDGTPCDEGAGADSNWCNSSCQSGVCTDGTAATCDDSLVCNGTETCDTASGCVAGTDAEDGTPCDEGTGANSDFCDSSCQSGVCDDGTAATCDDGLMCNGTESCDTGSGCTAGTDATDGTPCDEGAGQDGNGCNSSCQSGTCDAGTNATTGLACTDGFDCTTSDVCDGSGNCSGNKDDSYCDNLVSGDLCRPECFGGTSGCGTPPTSMTLTCTPNPVDLGSVDTTTCTLDLGTLTGQDVACLHCYPEVGLVTLEYNGFDSCAAGGWTMVTGNNCSSTVASCTPDATPAEACCETFPCVTAAGNSLLTSDLETNCGGAGNKEWRIEKTFDFTDTGTISVCYELGRDGGTGTEGVLVYAYDGTNGPIQVDCHNADYAGVDLAMYRHCAALPAWAEDNDAVTIQFVAHSEANAQAVLLDNIEISGWHADCTPATPAVIDEDFDSCTSGSPIADGFNDWAITGTIQCAQTFDCPAATLHAEVSGGAAILAKQVDASDLDGEVTLCFAYGDNDAGTDKALAVQFDPGDGWQDAWGQNGDAGADNECANICVNLSNIDPAVNRNAALGIRFVINSITDTVALDNVKLQGAQYCDGASAVTLGAYTDNSDGTYTFTAQNTLGDQLSADILCSWDTPPTGEEVEATEAVWFQP